MLPTPSRKYVIPQLLQIERRKRAAPIYRVDWEKFDRKIADKFTDWKQQFWPEEDIPYVKPLPDVYEELLGEMVYSIDRQHMDEIHYQVLAFWQTMSRVIDFGSHMDEICKEPAFAHMWSAFQILADCAFDIHQGRYLRGYKKIILPHVIAFKFWFRQTGRGYIWELSRLSELGEIGCRPPQHLQEHFLVLDELLVGLNAQLNLLFDSYKVQIIREDEIPVEEEGTATPTL